MPLSQLKFYALHQVGPEKGAVFYSETEKYEVFLPLSLLKTYRNQVFAQTEKPDFKGPRGVIPYNEIARCLFAASPFGEDLRCAARDTVSGQPMKLMELDRDTGHIWFSNGKVHKDLSEGQIRACLRGTCHDGEHYPDQELISALDKIRHVSQDRFRSSRRNFY